VDYKRSFGVCWLNRWTTLFIFLEGLSLTQQLRLFWEHALEVNGLTDHARFRSTCKWTLQVCSSQKNNNNNNPPPPPDNNARSHGESARSEFKGGAWKRKCWANNRLLLQQRDRSALLSEMPFKRRGRSFPFSLRAHTFAYSLGANLWIWCSKTNVHYKTVYWIQHSDHLKNLEQMKLCVGIAAIPAIRIPTASAIDTQAMLNSLWRLGMSLWTRRKVLT
jgi:hypothetical protein